MSGVIAVNAGSKPTVVAASTPRKAVIATKSARQGSVVMAGLRGPAGSQGIPGPAGGEIVMRAAGQPLSALRVVYESNGQVFLLDQQDGANIDFMLGITVSAAANVGDQVEVQRSGTIDDSGWNWAANLLYLGSAGQLTQTVPTTGWELVVGNSPSPQRLNIDFDDPIQL